MQVIMALDIQARSVSLPPVNGQWRKGTVIEGLLVTLRGLGAGMIEYQLEDLQLGNRVVATGFAHDEVEALNLCAIAVGMWQNVFGRAFDTRGMK